MFFCFVFRFAWTVCFLSTHHITLWDQDPGYYQDQNFSFLDCQPVFGGSTGMFLGCCDVAASALIFSLFKDHWHISSVYSSWCPRKHKEKMVINSWKIARSDCSVRLWTLLPFSFFHNSKLVACLQIQDENPWCCCPQPLQILKSDIISV